MSLFICSISFIILWEQKQQFVSQLTDFGESLVRIAASNAADKILGKKIWSSSSWPRTWRKTSRCFLR